jgi:hypothetical protein
MVDKISSIIQVNISRSSTTVSQAGFGTALLIGDLANTYDEGFPALWATRVISVSSAGELDTTHGFDTTKAIYHAALAYFSQEVKPTALYVGYYDSGTGESATIGLAAIRASASGDDWYALNCTDRTSGAAGDQWELAQLMQAENRIFLSASADVNTYDTADATSTAYLAKNASHQNTAILYHSGAAATTTTAGWADMAWLGRMLPTEPGEVTWAYKTLVGISPDNALTTAQRNAITPHIGYSGVTHYASYYDTIKSKSGTRFGHVASGLYLDSIRLAHWTVARCQEALYAKLAALPKLPFTDEGISVAKSEVRRVLERKVPEAIAQIDYVTAPKAADVSSANKLLRTLPDLDFGYTESGAIHMAVVNGVVSV